MPSRKRAKGKARKAKNNILFHHGPHQCRHGCSEILSENDVCCRFIVQLEREARGIFNSDVTRFNEAQPTNAPTTAEPTGASAFNDITNRLIKSNQFNEVFNDEAIQKKLLPQLLRVGTDCLLKDEHKEYYSMLATVVAITALFCQHNVNEDDILATKDREVYRDLFQGCEYDVIKFFAKRIPCNCLKEMYTRSKSEPKLMRCCHCKETKERKHLYLCGGCRCVHYCSVECQKADYSVHCSWCKKHGGRKIAG